ncbi:hypothetical protein [Patulibacter sp.]|uniref:hypothetical protein n=1 Tax=Patulibacter sp. TaxID=1912859 RepID=UPI002728AA10|nr:hypothetical protein [Patulibacter sp.]MDO9409857.1 hypothetical protein [Patulibacter sp.]
MATTLPSPVDHDDPLERLRALPAATDRPAVPAVRAPEPTALSRSVPRGPAADRAPGELDLAHRARLADRLHALVLDASRMRACDTRPQRAHRLQVLAARGRLADLEHVLRSGIPVRLRGERLVERLVSDDAIGVYCHGNPRAMHDDADAACAALGVLTAFH